MVTQTEHQRKQVPLLPERVHKQNGKEKDVKTLLKTSFLGGISNYILMFYFIFVVNILLG